MVPTATTVLRDGRTIAWSEVGQPDGAVVLSCLGTPHSRVPHIDDHTAAVAAGLRLPTVVACPGHGAHHGSFLQSFGLDATFSVPRGL